MKLPPYGKYLKDYLDAGLHVKEFVRIFIGLKSWERTKKSEKFIPFLLCLPPYKDPSLYAWPVKNCDILVYETHYTDMDLNKKLALYLLSFGANIVIFSSVDYHLVAVYEKDF